MNIQNTILFGFPIMNTNIDNCLLYTSDAADE